MASELRRKFENHLILNRLAVKTNGTIKFFQRKILNCKVYLLTMTYLDKSEAVIGFQN